MQINGTDIFLGAYAERRKNSNQLEQKALSVSKEKAEAHIAGIKEAFDSLNLQSRGVKVSVSKEDIKFLCSEEGFQKMKQDAEDLYMKNRNQQKVIAQGRDQGDLFWNNTGNQWMVFSEMLYKNGFYAGMDDEEVKQFEDTLASLTFGMDCLSRSQYLTGITFSSVQEEYKFFMSSGEAVTIAGSPYHNYSNYSTQSVNVNTETENYRISQDERSGYITVYDEKMEKE